MDDLATRMKAAGMVPLDDLLNGNTALDKWNVHTGVTDIDGFEWWIKSQHEQFTRMQIAYELGDSDKDDGLYEWVVAHKAVFGAVIANFRAAMKRPEASQ